MALTKQQVSLITLATLKAAPGGYSADLMALNSQAEVANLAINAGNMAALSDGEFALQVAKNLNATVTNGNSLYTDLVAGMSRADAVVKFANAELAKNGAQLNKDLDTAVKSSSTSTDLTALKAVVTPAAPVETVVFNTWSGTAGKGDAVNYIGKEAIDKGEGKISADYTFVLKNQVNVADATNTSNLGKTVANFKGGFLSPILERAAAQSSDSAIYVRLLDGFAARDNLQPIERLPTNGFGFSLDGAQIQVVSEGIYNAKNYTELRDAIVARLAELASGQNLPAGADAAAYAKLANFTVELGSTFTKTNQAGNQVSGTEVVIRDTEGGLLQPVGFSTFSGIHPYTDFNSINELDNQAPTTITQLISTNINAENVGYGSQGATLNIAGLSASEKGVEEFKVTATKGVWFTRLESRDVANNHHLQEVILQSGSEGYFRVGTQKNSQEILVALMNQNFGIAGGGLVDVLKLDASNLAGSVAVNAFVSDKVIDRNYNLQDTGVHTADDVQIQYGLSSGNDIIQLALASEVVAYADSQVTINTGTGGNDFVHLKIVNNALNVSDNVVNAGSSTYGNGWLVNQQLNDNIKVEAMSGNNTIWTEGSGNVRISTGAGNDVILADNSGRQTIADPAAVAKMASLGYGTQVNGLYVVNAASRELGNILSNSANGTDGVANLAQTFNTFKTTVSVSFMGLESSYIEIASTNYRTTTQQVNQAIKKAINEDATLNKLIQAIEFPGNVLVIESLIDGVRTLGELSFNFVAPAASGTLPAALQPGQLVLGTNDLTEAGKAYAPAGTVAPAVPAVTALNFANNAAGINTIYNTSKNFVSDGAAGAGTPEEQTLDFTATMAAGTIDAAGTIVIGGVTINVNLGDAAAAVATAVAAGLNGQILTGTTVAATATAAAGVVTVTFGAADGDVAALTVAGTATHTNGGPGTAISATITETVTGVASTGTDVTGVASTAHSDNVINAGAGNDAIVLGTGAGGSNDTVVLSGNFGKNTILNFDTAAVNDTAANSGDLLDFRSYLDANIAAVGGANVSITNATGAIANNAIAVIDFSALQGAVFALPVADQIATTAAMSSVTATQWDKLINAAYDAAATATKNVFIVHNDNTTPTLDNMGEYLVLTASSSNAAGAAGTTFTGVTVVGTLDFGSNANLQTAVNFAGNMAGNLVGFEGAII